jgi:hypothetical protein
MVHAAINLDRMLGKQSVSVQDIVPFALFFEPRQRIDPLSKQPESGSRSHVREYFPVGLDHPTIREMLRTSNIP